ncbi:MAG: hypothetical protein ACJ762_14935 [Solirubrobacteraceae bacterium]
MSGGRRAILDRMANAEWAAPGHHFVMHDEPRFTRLAMVRLGGGGAGVRRYGLARLDEIALASPPVRSKIALAEPRDDARDDGTAPCDA